MKNLIRYSAGILALAITACSAPRQSLQLTNATDQDKKDELVVLTRAQVQRFTGKLSPEKYIIITRPGQTGPPVLVQHDDLNHDGVWDEIAFMLSPAAGEKNEWKLEPPMRRQRSRPLYVHTYAKRESRVMVHSVPIWKRIVSLQVSSPLISAKKNYRHFSQKVPPGKTIRLAFVFISMDATAKTFGERPHPAWCSMK